VTARWLGLLLCVPAVCTSGELDRSLQSGAQLAATKCWFEIPAGRAVECAHFRPSQQIPGHPVRLPVVIIRSTGEGRRASPILYLPGGPGAPTGLREGREISGWWNWMSAARWPHDIVLFDMRGVGLSEPKLDCPEVIAADRAALPRPISPLEDARMLRQSAASCYRRLRAEGLDPAGFSTEAHVRDAHELMQLLGDRQWNLYGISYGTRLAMQLARRHPEHIRSIVLDSAYPPEVNGLLSRPGQFDRALELLVSYCATDRECAKSQPALRQQLGEVLRRLGREPVMLQVKQAFASEAVAFKLTDYRFVWMLFLDSYQPRYRPLAVPAIQGAFEQDYRASQALAADYVAELLDEGFSEGVYFATTCAEDFPSASRKAYLAELRRHPRVEPYVGPEWDENVCHDWTPVALPADYSAPVLSTVPTLFLSGRSDAATLPEWSIRAVQGFKGGNYVAFEGSSHAVTWENHCAMAVVWEFLKEPGGGWSMPPCLTPREVKEAIRPAGRP
jgi:pimeloyl-ACP methyl ester carboxylesterase